MVQIEVVARFDARGNVIPQRLTWQDRSYAVESIGRRWDESDGQHILVLTPNGQTFELVYMLLDDSWYLARPPDQRKLG